MCVKCRKRICQAVPAFASHGQCRKAGDNFAFRFSLLIISLLAIILRVRNAHDIVVLSCLLPTFSLKFVFLIMATSWQDFMETRSQTSLFLPLIFTLISIAIFTLMFARSKTSLPIAELTKMPLRYNRKPRIVRIRDFAEHNT